MSTIATPNWLAITATLVMVSGIAILARAAICRAPDGASADQRRIAANRSVLNTNIGSATLALGAFMQIASQVTAPAFNAVMVAIALVLAFGLLLYGCLEHLLAETLFPAKEPARQSAPLLQLIAASADRERKTTSRSVEAAALP